MVFPWTGALAVFVSFPNDSYALWDRHGKPVFCISNRTNTNTLFYVLCLCFLLITPFIMFFVLLLCIKYSKKDPCVCFAHILIARPPGWVGFQVWNGLNTLGRGLFDIIWSTVDIQKMHMISILNSVSSLHQRWSREGLNRGYILLPNYRDNCTVEHNLSESPTRFSSHVT